MNGINNSADDVVECPLCMEPLEVDDLNFYPCTCGYQICRFCWHRIRTDENKLCPACRKEYPENPADFTPLTQEQMIAFKSQKRQRDQQRKQKITENRKHLANVRVVQKNLVFVVGLPPRLADADILKKHEYFGKYGKIHKVVINPSTTYAGVQGPSASAYVTYVHNSDALRAIQSVNNIMIDGRLIKTSLGTTKYCSHFMKNQQCPKSDCMYLHELGDPEASFTKEEMHQGKHQEYEKRLHDTLIASAGTSTGNGMVGQTTTSSGISVGGTTKINASSMSSSSSSSTSVSSAVGTQNSAPAAGVSPTQKEAWPSLAVSPVHSKDTTASGNNVTNKNKKDKQRNEKSRNEKTSKQKTKTVNHSNSNTSNKENHLPITEDQIIATIPTESPLVTTAIKSEQSKTRSDRLKDKSGISQTQQEHHTDTSSTDLPIEEELSLAEADITCGKSEQTPSKHATETLKNKQEASTHRSMSLSSNISDGRTSGLSESSPSGKSSPGAYQNSHSNSSNAMTYKMESTVDINTTLDTSGLNKVNTSYLEKLTTDSSEDKSPSPESDANVHKGSEIGNSADSFLASDGLSTELSAQNNIASDNILDTTAGLSKLNMFEDCNSFFSSNNSFQQSLFLKNKIAAELRQNQLNNISSSHLPDLLNGIDGYQKSSNTNEWEEAFKNVMMRNNKHVEEQLLHQQHLQQQQQQHHQQLLQQQEEFLRMHELQKRNNILNNIAHSQLNDFPSSFNGNADLGRLSNSTLTHQQHQLLQQSNDTMIPNNMFGASMSKFFDFHKTQQQLHQQTDPLRMTSFLDNNRVNSQYIDNNIMAQQQFQKQRLLGKLDSVPTTQGSQPQQSQPNVLPNQLSQNSPVDDDLGFDPFIETQKGLAELMENEIVHKQNTNLPSVANGSSKLLQHQQVSQQQQMLDNIQRARMPPPGFNHMNTFGFGVQRSQNTNKAVPFLNMAATGGNSTQVGQQLQIPVSNSWSPHMHGFSQQSQHQQQLPINETQLLLQLNQAQSSGSHSKGYGANDWTAMDPAILSFRQFSSFPQTQMPPHPQQQQDMFMQHLVQQQQQQQQQQQNSQGFSNQTQLINGINSVPNNLLNVQQTSQAQVNANVQGMLEFLKNRQFV